LKVADAWKLLGLEPTDDAREVKRAYGRRLKQIDVEADAASFIRLREARALATSWGKQAPEWEADEDQDWDDLDGAGDAGSESCPRLPADEHPVEAPLAPFSWRPALPSGSCNQLASLREELNTLLFDQPVPNPDQVIAVGNALLCACATASVDDVNGTERWLLAALAASIPRSDPLIERTMRRFRWDIDLRANDFDFELDLEALQQRLEDRRVQRAIHVHHPSRRALDELRGPPRSRLGLFELSLSHQVHQFLDQTLVTHPTIEHDLNPESVAWWRTYLARRHLPSSFWMQLLAGPPVLTLAGALAVKVTGLSVPLTLPLGFLGAVGATMVAILGVAELRARHAAYEEKWQYHGYEARRIEAWLFAAYLLPLGAALVAYAWWTAALCNLCALVVAVGGYLNTRHPQAAITPESLFIPRFPVMAAVAAFLALLLLAPLQAIHAAGPLATLCFLAFRSHEAAEIRLDSLPESRVRMIHIVSAVLLTAAIVLLFSFVPSPPPAIALMLVPIAVALQHLATANTYLVTVGIEWVVRVAAVLFYWTASSTLFGDRWKGLAASILLYTLAYSLIRTILALSRSDQSPPPSQPL
jgi:hypothetical protein